MTVSPQAPPSGQPVRATGVPAAIHETVTGAEPGDPTVGQLVSEASAHLSTLIRSEIELAKLELRSTVKNAGVGVGLFAAAGVVLVFSLTFLFLTIAEGLAALGLSRWLSFLIVWLFLMLLVGAFAFIGLKKVKRIKAPERTISTSKETVAYLKSHG